MAAAGQDGPPEKAGRTASEMGFSLHDNLRGVWIDWDGSAVAVKEADCVECETTRRRLETYEKRSRPYLQIQLLMHIILFRFLFGHGSCRCVNCMPISIWPPSLSGDREIASLSSIFFYIMTLSSCNFLIIAKT